MRLILILNSIFKLPYFLRIIMISMLSIASSPAYTDTQQELFEKLFGKSNKSISSTISVPVVIDDMEFSQIRIKNPLSKTKTMIETSIIKSILLHYLTEHDYITSSSLISDVEFTSLETLKADGISYNYDAEKLILFIYISGNIRKIQQYSLTKNMLKDTNTEYIEPARFSAYLNSYGEHNYITNRNNYGSETLSTSNIAMNSVININDYVLSAEGFYQNYLPNKPWHRGNICLSHDVVKNSMRITGGDQNIETRGFQLGQRLLGLSLDKNFSIQPDKINRTLGKKQFVLDSRSSVEIMINNQTYKTLNLAAGRYLLSDFPLSGGINDIVLNITDQFGRSRTLEFPLFYNSSLLPESVHDYYYAFGYPTHGVNYDYATHANFFSGYHRLGINESLTLGANLQSFDDFYLVGAEVSTSTSIGNGSINATVNRNKTGEQGYAWSFLYNWHDASNTINNNWDLTNIVYNREFNNDPFSNNRQTTRRETAISYNHSLTQQTSVSLRAQQVDFFDQSTRNEISLFMNQRITPALSWDFSIGQVVDCNCNEDGNLYTNINLSYNFGKRRNNLRSSYRSTDKEKSISFNRRPVNSLYGLNVFTEFKQNTSHETLKAEAHYQGNRFYTSLIHNQISSQDINIGETNSSTLRWASALVYADGNTALSNTVTDSFAIISTSNNISDHAVVIDSYHDHHSAKSDALGAAVVSDLVGYKTRQLSIDVENLPLGFEMGDGLSYLLPRHKTGSVIHIGTDATVLLRASLVDEKDQLLPLTYGHIRNLEQPDLKPIMFFTNRSGMLVAEGLKPGKYELQIFSGNNLKQPLLIPDDTEGVYHAGTLQFK